MKKQGLLGAYVALIERLGGVRTNARRLFRPAFVRREIRQAERFLPGLARVAEGLTGSRSSLASEYTDYTSTISTGVFALSLETSAFLDSYCAVLRPRTILDLGSGFSSFVLTRYQRASGESVLVTTVDDDEDWLRETAGYLSRHGLATAGLISLDRLGDAAMREYDLVCYDLGNFETRSRLLPTVLDHARPCSGVVLLDDCHRGNYREGVVRELSRRRATSIELRELTGDSFGRFCWLATGFGGTSRQDTEPGP